MRAARRNITVKMTQATLLLAAAAIAFVLHIFRSDGVLALQTTILVPAGCFLHPSASIVELSETERGIRIIGDAAGDGIPPNDILLSVPLDQIITLEYGYATPAGQAVRRKSCRSSNMIIDDHTYLAIWLCETMAQREEESNGQTSSLLLLSPDIKAYLDSLPQPAALRHLPVFWSPEDLSELDGSQLKIETLEKRAHWEALYRFIGDCFPPFAERTGSLDTFLWAMGVVHSRVFHLREDYFEDETTNIEQRGIGLVPMADMLNHRIRSDPSTCDWRVEKDRRAFVIRTSAKGLKSGSEACHS